MFVLECEYLNINASGVAESSIVLYMDGDSCVSTTADPLLIQTTLLQIVPTRLVNLSIPLLDDTRSDLLGAYTLNPTDDTASRYIHLSRYAMTGSFFPFFVFKYLNTKKRKAWKQG